MILTRRYNIDRFGYLIPHRYGNLPMLGAVATFRPGEGRFGRGAVAVEEGTTNLISSNRLKFEGWEAYRGASVTVEQGHSIPGITPDGATRIQTSGGTEVVKYLISVGTGAAGTPASYRVWVRNIGDKPVRVFGNAINVSNIVYPGETKLCTGSTDAVNGIANRQIQFRALNVDDSLDFIAYQPQIEEKPFATSFVAGTRAAGALKYQATALAGESYTVSLWAKANTNAPSRLQVLFDGRSIMGNGSSQSLLGVSTSGVLMVYYQNGAGTNTSQSTSYVLADRIGWHHYALVFEGPRSGGMFRVYVDGVQVYSFSTSLYAPSSDPKLSIGLGDLGEYWNGLIDELLILPYAASDEEIRTWYEADGPIPPHPDALLQWDWQAVRPATMVAL